MTLREKLIVLRDKAGLSQMSLAHQLDVSRQAVSRWESGDTTPSMDKLKALAKIYGVSLDWLCSDSDMADEKPIEVVSPLEENETKNTTVSAKDKRKRKIRFVAIALVVGVITLSGCTEKNEHELEQKAIETEHWEIGKNVDEGLPQDRLNEKIKLTVGGIGLNESSIMGSISYIGWPTVDGSNGTDIRLTQAVGINKATKNIEGCWEFVKYLLKNPILIDNASGMPTYAPLVSEDLEMLNSGEPKFKTTEEDMEIVINLAKESEQLTYYDEEVMNIILNESSAFIQGNTSASETAKRIQSRVSLYMKEQYE